MEIFWGVVISNLTFIAVAYVINEKNVDVLLAGNNTMSKKEKEFFDLNGCLIFFKKFFLNLGIYTSLIFLFFYAAFGEVIAIFTYFISIL